MADPPQVTGDTSAGGMLRDTRGNTSSKRVAGLSALFNVLAIMWYCTVTGKPADPVMILSAWVFTFGCFALTIPEWFGKPK